MGYIRLMGIHRRVLDALMDRPSFEDRKEIDRMTSEIGSQPEDGHHLSGGILFWISRNLDGYNSSDKFTSEGRALIERYCVKEGIDAANYGDLISERKSGKVGYLEAERNEDDIQEQVFYGLMYRPSPSFYHEVIRAIKISARQSSDTRHLAGSILFWMGRNLDGYNSPDQYTSEGQGLIQCYCIKEGVNTKDYEYLISERIGEELGESELERADGIEDMVFGGLMHTPHPDFHHEIMREIREAARQTVDTRHLAGGILFWIGRNLDDYNTPEEFSAEGQVLLHSYCIKEGIGEDGYNDLVEERWVNPDSD